MSEIRQWLCDLGLGQHAEAFEANDIDMGLLPSVDDQTLKDIGVTSAGHRLRIRAAIGRLDGGSSRQPATVADPVVQQLVSPSAERRQLTVMFCDLVGSTELSHKVDPEALRELLRTYQQACGAIIDKYEGHVAQYLGDGLMVYFGWPRAHEDDAERAVRASIEIVETVKHVPAPEPLRVRIGISTGSVVVGETGAGDASVPNVAVGETPNLAARLQGLAQADQIIVSPSTLRLLSGAFAYEDMGQRTLKGIVEPIHVHRVLGPSRTEGRFEASRGDRLTPLVGREEEIGQLLRRWEQAKSGEGQVVLIGGEPGIGKSRITRALRERLEGQPLIRMRYQCSPFHSQSALHPVIEQFERAADFGRDDDPQTKMEKIEAVLGQALRSDQVRTVAPLFAAMLSVPAHAYAPISLTPQKLKERTLEALVEQIAGLSANRPVLMVFEDLHWVDPTTDEVLDLLIRRIARLPVLLVMTYRLEYSPRWSGEPHVTSLSVSRLNRRLGAELADKVTGGKPLPQSVLDEILVKTDGVPLFVEELTRAVLEGGLVRLGPQGYELVGPLSSLAIPSTLQDSLMSRLDRLSEVREVAQIGACIGREFSHELLVAVSPSSESALRSALEQLSAADLIFRRGAPPEAVYTFKHALVQDAAYASLLNSKRQVLHRLIAQTLEKSFAGQLAAAPEVAAHHYDAAGLPQQSVPYWMQAGRRAIERFANPEAIGHLRNGLAALGNLPAGPERDRMELLLQADLGTALGTSMGYTPPEVMQVFERARDLSQVVGDVPQKFTILFGLWVSFLMRADYPTSWKLSRELLDLAQTATEPGAQVVARQCMSCTALFTGDLDIALEYARAGIGFYRDSGCASLGPAYGFDAGVLCFEWEAWALLMKGFPDQAAAVWSESSRLALAHGHPLTIATNKVHCAGFHNLRDDHQSTLTHATDAAAYSGEHGILLRQVESWILEGWAQAEMGNAVDGIHRAESGLIAWRQLGARIWDSGWYLYLARAHLCVGDTVKCRAALTEALNAAHSHGEHACTAELYRFEGELCLAEGQPIIVAESLFRKAIRRAQEQKAKLWELRAAIALAKLWHSQSKRKDAYDLLHSVYAWFTEGFETKDLKEAKVFLLELKA